MLTAVGAGATIALTGCSGNSQDGDGSGEYGLVGDDVFYPGDEWKGDVARIIMYVNLRYGEGFSTVGGIDLFLKWNREDPVSAFELQRQEVIEAAQGQGLQASRKSADDKPDNSQP